MKIYPSAQLDLGITSQPGSQADVTLTNELRIPAPTLPQNFGTYGYLQSLYTPGSPQNISTLMTRDGLSVMTGLLVLGVEGTNDNDLVSKSYISTSISAVTSAVQAALPDITPEIDAALVDFGAIKTGMIVKKPTDVTPVGYLRANGAYVGKTEYSNLYAVYQGTYGSNTTQFGLPNMSAQDAVEPGLFSYIKT